jgi:hypothetical protein
MEEILLSSESFIKSVSNISDNLSGKYILPALREAQEIDLRGILGDNLLTKIKDLVADNTINSEPFLDYKALVDKCQYYLAYTVIARLCVITSYKINNVGVNKTADENMDVVSQEEIYHIQDYYQKKADYYCYLIQHYILENRALYPELDGCHCNKIKANLYSAASGGLWLGGPRAKGGCV